MTADDANVRLVDHAREARPELHTLYRFWVAAQAAGEPVDQEFDGWWSGRNWHALYDIGIWDPEFVVRFEPLADAELAEQRERSNAAIDRARMERAQAEDRETELDERVAELEAALQRSRDAHRGAEERLRAVETLADSWAEGVRVDVSMGTPKADVEPLERLIGHLRAALAPATSPAEQEGHSWTDEDLARLGQRLRDAAEPAPKDPPDTSWVTEVPGS